MSGQGQLDLALRGGRGAMIKVSDLVRRIRDTLDENLDEFWVVGEVSNARLAPSNHFYFTLKDDRASISVVMFRSAFIRVRFKVTDGMEIVVRGRVSLFDARGTLQLYAEEIEPRGVGALQVAFDQLKRRLAAEGLFEQSRKRALPYLPQTVGIVTARGGAGLRDMLRILFDRFPNLHVIFRPARVQGDGACNEVARAIADLNHDGRAEVIIVGRGGGSLEDLWCFNEEVVARAIARSRIPIVSAVGHEVDFTIADFVADLRAPTPTAAAAMVVPSKAELRERIAADDASLRLTTERVVEELRETVDDLAARIRHPRNVIAAARTRLIDAAVELRDSIARRVADSRRTIRERMLGLRAPDATVREARLRVSRLALTLAHGMERSSKVLDHRIEALDLRVAAGGRRILEERRAALGAVAGRLDSLSPLKVLDRGYAVVINSRNGRVATDAAKVELDDELDIRLARGKLRARTTAREV
jgi:exodeoxyribonuclease VII large subunit